MCEYVDVLVKLGIMYDWLKMIVFSSFEFVLNLMFNGI